VKQTVLSPPNPNETVLKPLPIPLNVEPNLMPNDESPAPIPVKQTAILPMQPKMNLDVPPASTNGDCHIPNDAKSTMKSLHLPKSIPTLPSPPKSVLKKPDSLVSNTVDGSTTPKQSKGELPKLKMKQNRESSESDQSNSTHLQNDLKRRYVMHFIN